MVSPPFSGQNDNAPSGEDTSVSPWLSRAAELPDRRPFSATQIKRFSSGLLEQVRFADLHRPAYLWTLYCTSHPRTMPLEDADFLYRWLTGRCSESRGSCRTEQGDDLKKQGCSRGARTRCNRNRALMIIVRQMSDCEPAQPSRLPCPRMRTLSPPASSFGRGFPFLPYFSA